MPESDADHSFSTALLVLLLAPENLDKLKCMELALIHDLAEVYAGDVTPDDVSAVDKLKAEKASILRLSKELGWEKLVNLFDEYEDKFTKEAIFVNALDKVDTVMTAAFYDREKRAPQKLSSEFQNYAQKRVEKLKSDDLGEIKSLLKYLQEQSS